MAWAIAEGDVPLQDKSGLTALVIALRVVLLITGVGLEAIWSRTGGTLENLCIGVSESNCDVTHSFLPEADSDDSGYGPNDSGLTMRHVTDCAYIESGLSAHDLGGVRSEIGHVFVVLGPEFLELGVELVNFFFGQSRDRIHLLL